MSGRIVTVACARCGVSCQKQASHFNRSTRIGAPLYCGLACSSATRRVEKAAEQRKADKAKYDKEYRRKNTERLRAERAARHKATYDREQARVARKERRDWQRAYAKQYNADPENKKHKEQYDCELRAKKYGEFAEAYRLMLELEKEVRRLEPDCYERRKARGYYERINEANREKRRRTHE